MALLCIVFAIVNIIIENYESAIVYAIISVTYTLVKIGENLERGR